MNLRQNQLERLSPGCYQYRPVLYISYFSRLWRRRKWLANQPPPAPSVWNFFRVSYSFLLAHSWVFSPPHHFFCLPHHLSPCTRLSCWILFIVRRTLASFDCISSRFSVPDSLTDFVYQILIYKAWKDIPADIRIKIFSSGTLGKFWTFENCVLPNRKCNNDFRVVFESHYIFHYL